MVIWFIFKLLEKEENMKTEIIILISTLSGTFIGGLISIIMVLITKRAEDRRHLREVLLKTALENWKVSVKVAKENVKAIGETLPIYPLDDYILHFHNLWELLTKKKVGRKEIDELTKKTIELNKLLESSRKKYEEQNNAS